MAFTRMNLGMIAFGGGTQASVVCSELEPSTEYEYLPANDALTCDVTLPELKKNPRLLLCESIVTERLSSISVVLVTDILIRIVEFVN